MSNQKSPVQVFRWCSLHILVGAFLICATGEEAMAQSVSREFKLYQSAKDLYDKGLYGASSEHFNDFILNYPESNLIPNANYYIASCAVRLSNPSGQQMILNFIKDYQGHPLANSALFDLIIYYFELGSYSEIVAAVDKTELSLDEIESSELLFKIGYAHFNQGRFKDGSRMFEKIPVGLSLQNDAAYYQGIIEERSGNNDAASEYYELALDSDEFQQPAIKNYIRLLYDNKNYQQLVDVVDDSGEFSDDPFVFKLLGEAYFELGKYSAASFNFKEYLRLSKKKSDYVISYKLGVCASNLDDSNAALDFYKKAALSKDTLGAYASYKIGTIYISDSNYVFASPAFKKASKFNIELQEDASFLHAKSEFDQGNFSGAISLFNEHMNKYPNGTYSVESTEMLSDSYLNSNDYSQAIEYIEGLDHLTENIKKSYQFVTFHKGTERFNKRRFFESIGYFKKSLKYAVNDELGADANYWIGEAYSIGKKYDQAIPYYTSTVRINSGNNIDKAIYGLGYAHYNLRKYGEAAVQFEKLLKAENLGERHNADLLMRLADCYFVAKKYENAISQYRSSLDAGNKNKSYLHFQIGLALNYLRDNESAVAEFNTIVQSYPESDRADDAMFQIAQIRYENGQFGDAIPVFESLIEKYPESKYLPHAVLNTAVSFYNLSQYDRAKENYVLLLEKYTRHSTANSALLGLQELAGIGEFDDFDSYLSLFRKANPESSALENIVYETAKTQFYNQKYDEAIAGFNDFRLQYPDSELNLDAIYFIGDSWYRKEQYDSALAAFDQIKDVHEYPKYLRIQYRMAIINQNLNNLEESNSYFHVLRSGSSNAKQTINAQRGLMFNMFSQEIYDSAKWYGDALLKGTRISRDLESRTILTIGKSEYFLGNADEALDWFITLINSSPDEFGAEAKYFTSLILYEKKDHKQSLQALFDLSKEYSAYEEWVGKAFLLMADNYVATDEVFQASATLNSLIENSPFESIKSEARQKLEQIEKAESTAVNDTTELNDEN